MKTQSGFTLVEVMITLLVAIIVLAVGVPAFLNMASTNQAAGYANDLVTALRLARSEAIKRADSVVVCASNSGQTDCSSGNWQNGWIVFTDNDADDTYDAGETILRKWSIPTNERAYLSFTASSPDTVRFVSTGANSLDAEIKLTFKKQDCSANQAREITISRLGRASLAMVTCF